MKNILLFFLCTFSFASFLSAQDAQSVSEEEMDRNTFGNPFNYSHQNYYTSKKLKYEVEDEKFFVNKEWMLLKAIGKEGEEMSINKGNYLIETRIILFKKDGKMFQVFPHTVKMVIVGNDIYKAYPSVNKKSNGILEFYQVPVAGNLELIKVWDIKEMAVSNNPMGIPDANKVTIVKSSKLYYKKGSKKSLERLPKKKADVISLFGRHKKSVQEYAKKHGLSFKKEADLINLFTYYNSKLPKTTE